MTAGTEAARRPSTRAERQRVYRRRRLLAAVVGVFLAFLLVRGCSAVIGGGGEEASEAAAPELPRGGRDILPRHRVVAFYGAPQDEELGVLGTTTPQEAVPRLARQAREYERPGRPVLPAFELIVTLAQSAAGDDGKHRLQQTNEVIREHLRAVREMRGLLLLDVQPGQADFVEEVRALEPYLTQPDVGLALDPEWSVPVGTAPGSVIGSTDAATVNEISEYLSRIVRARRLPEKLLIVHQFTEDMVTDRELIRSRPGVALVSNMDGFGTAELKEGVYGQLSNPRPPRAPLRGRPRGGKEPFNGFKLFYREDTGLMSPAEVLALDPAPDVIVYE